MFNGRFLGFYGDFLIIGYIFWYGKWLGAIFKLGLYLVGESLLIYFEPELWCARILLGVAFKLFEFILGGVNLRIGWTGFLSSNILGEDKDAEGDTVIQRVLWLGVIWRICGIWVIILGLSYIFNIWLGICWIGKKFEYLIW